MTTRRVEVIVNGKPVSVDAGITVAAVLLNLGESVFRTSATRESRGPLCGMGICWECRATIDGVPHQRACMRAVADGLRVETGRRDAR